MQLLYVHGLGGTKNGSTSQNLKDICEKNNITFHSFDVPFKPKDAVAKIKDYVKENNIDVVVSSSLGAFYTLASSLEFILSKKKKREVKFIVINPAFDAYNDILNNFGKGNKEYRGIREDGIQTYKLDDDFYKELKDIQKEFYKKIKNKYFNSWSGYFSTNDEYFSHKADFRKHSLKICTINDTHHIGKKNLEIIVSGIKPR